MQTPPTVAVSPGRSTRIAIPALFGYRAVMETIVTVFAHPDDEAAGMGGTLWLLKDQVRIVLLCLTRGERGLRPTAERGELEIGKLREGELRETARLLGADVRFLGPTDGEVYADREICEDVASILRAEEPTAVFTIWPIDVHPDHRAAANIARRAMQLSRCTAELWMAEMGLSQTAQFDPDICVDISSVVEEKNRLIRCHVCQNTDDRLVTQTALLNRLRGAKAGVTAAEAFKAPLTRLAGRVSLFDRLPCFAPPEA